MTEVKVFLVHCNVLIYFSCELHLQSFICAFFLNSLNTLKKNTTLHFSIKHSFSVTVCSKQIFYLSLYLKIYIAVTVGHLQCDDVLPRTVHISLG